MPEQLRTNEFRKIAKDFLRRADSAPTKEERDDFLDMARAIEHAGPAKRPANDRSR